ncbi:MAG: translocation/assembly module TamB domain-containing protein [Candidatus Tyrphobacter sp.]
MRKHVVVPLAILLVLLGIGVAKRHEVVHFVLTHALALATGDDVGLADQRIGGSHAALIGLRLVRRGVTVLSAPRIDVWYSLRDLLPGSKRRFGLVGIAVERPAIALVKYADGSDDLPIHAPAPHLPTLSPAPNAVPLRFFLRVRDASATVREEGGGAPLVARGIDIGGTIDTAGRTQYAATGAFVERTPEPFSVRGTIDQTLGYADHRMRARAFPLAAVADFFINSKDVNVLGGSARGFDASAFAVGRKPDGALDYQYSLGFDLVGGRLKLVGLVHPVEGIRGRLALYDDTFFLRGLHAMLVGIPLQAEGSIFNFSRAQIRIAVTGNGDMAQLRKAFRFSVDQPLAGPLTLGILVEGALGDPSVVADATAPRVWYRGFPFDALRARIVYHHEIVAFAPLRLRYGGIAATGRGTLELGDHIRERMMLHFMAPASRLPYAGALLGSEPLNGDAAIDGSDLLVRVTGSLAARSGVNDAAALFDFGPDGVADVAPFWMHAGAGDLAAGFHLDRPNGTSAFWIAADDVSMHGSSAGTLPGVTLPQMPPIAGRVRSIGIVGGAAAGTVALAGRVSAERAAIASVPFDAVTASFDGTMGGAAIDRIAATGPWGRFSGTGIFSGSEILTRGRFDGRLDALAPLLSGVRARGDVHGEVALGIERDGIIVQASGLRLDRASVDGVPVTEADGTLLVGNDAVHVYSAHARAGGGDVVAAGNYRIAGTSAPNGLALVAEDVDAGSLRALGLPLERGRLAVAGTLFAGAPLPSFSGEVSIANGAVQGYPLAGSAGVNFTGSRVTFDRVVAAMSGIYGFADGSIDAVDTSAPRFDLHAVAPAGDVAAALRALRLPSYYAQGTFEADVRIAGSGRIPSVTGTIGVPAGSINGLPFLDASGLLAAGGSGISIRNGSVLVGTTLTGFDAAVAPRSGALQIRASAADFADFNNFFDTGDTLAGTGSIAASLAEAGAHVRTSGNIDVRAFRFRSLPIGDTVARWSSRRNVVRANLSVGGAEGLLRARGSVALSPTDRWQDTIKRSRYNLVASIDNLDLGLWVSALGFPQVPITGRAFGSARMIGTYPALSLQGSARLRDGTFGRFPIDLLQVRFGSNGRRLQIEQAQIQGPGIAADASGSVGLRGTDPVDLRVDAKTDDLSGFLAEVTRAHVPVSGAFQGTLRVGGSFAVPVLDARLSAQNVRIAGVPIATMFASVRLQRNRVEVYDAGATFVRGRATISGDVPLRLQPFSLPKNTPVHFTLDASDVDASVFDALFGHDTKLGGVIATNVDLAGTVENPRISGSISVAHGSYSSLLDEAPVSNAAGTLAFSGARVDLTRFTANAGSGSVALSGTADLAGASGPAFDGAMTLHGAQFNSPTYGSATIGGNLSFARSSGNALLSGDLTMTNTTIPFAAFVGGAAGAGGTALNLPLAFNLKLNAGQNVRVRGSGYGAGLDISGTGSAVLAGTLSSPTLSGGFLSSGGTLTYFDRSFRVVQGGVSFDPADGIVPTLHAIATATVVNPDPDVARNPFGSATITIAVSGPVDNLKIDFTSDPLGYSREQIIAMLAPFGGFISGIQFNPYEVQIPGGAAAAINNAPVPGGVFVQRNGTITVSQEAFSILNAQFASGLLAPFENVLGQTLGVSDVNFTLGYFGNFGVSVRRVLGKTVTAVYSSTFGLSSRQTFGIRFAPNALNDASLSFFYQTGQLRLFATPGEQFGPVLLGEPLQGQSGFSFTFQHFFK